METGNKITLIGIIVENKSVIEKMNGILHEFSDYIVGRMGVPYKKHQFGIISLIMDAPSQTIASFSEKLGKLDGITVKTVY